MHTNFFQEISINSLHQINLKWHQNSELIHIKYQSVKIAKRI